jgi:hypothetical protein
LVGGDDRVNQDGVVLDALRTVIGVSLDDGRRASVTSPAGRAARAALHLEIARPSPSGDRACLEGPKFFEKHHAYLCAGPKDQGVLALGESNNQENEWPVDVYHFGQGSLTWSTRAEVNFAQLGTYFRTLEEESLFHLAFCEGVRRSAFLGSNGEPALLRAAWPDLAQEVGPSIFESSIAKKRCGDKGEAYLTLAVVAASQMFGLAAQPLLDQFVRQVVAHLTGDRNAAEGLDFSHYFGDKPLPPVPFASPANTPWPEELHAKCAPLGICLGDTQRVKDLAQYDLRLGSHVTGEVKNWGDNMSIGDFAAVCKRVPKAEGEQLLVHWVLLNSTLSAFTQTDTLKQLQLLPEQERTRVVRIVRKDGVFKFEDVFVLAHPTPQTQTLVIVVELRALGVDLLGAI